MRRRLQTALATLKGDIVNDRTAIAVGEGSGMRTLVDAGGSISARDTLTIKSARDLTNSAVISSGGDASLSATRDLNLLATRNESEIHDIAEGGHRSTITTTVENLASSVTAGGNLTLNAGRDLTLASAGDEHNVETHSKDGKKRIHEEDNHTVQKAAELSAGGNVVTRSERDTTLVASKISAGNEAYVYAGNDLNLLAAQNKDYTLYDMKEKGGFGAEKTQRDEVTQITHVGSEIKTGGNLTLISEGDQRYQVAKLESGKEITLDSGGSITFEAVKDLHDESHTKSNSNAAWNSMKGKGNTDETVRQSELVANGALVIKAVNGLKIDIKQIDQKSVSQTIDSMVAADPKLAWLKEAEQRGDVDWRRVEEIHKSFKYSSSGLGVAAQLALAILLAAVTGGAGAALMGATAGTFKAGFANAVLIAMETTAANSAISNKGNLGSVLKDTFSSESLKGYVLSGVLGGIGSSSLGYDPSKIGFDLDSLGQVVIKSGADTVAQTVLQGGSLGDNFVDNLLGAVVNIGGAIAANKVGNLNLIDGSPTKIAAHALVGGLKSMAMGGDFKTGALAGGANEALVQYLADLVLPEGYDPSMPGAEQAKANLLAMSQLLGVLTAVLSDSDPTIAANIAANATQYNYLNHSDLDRAANELVGCGNDAQCVTKAYTSYRELSQHQEMDALVQCGQDPANCGRIANLVAKAQEDTEHFRDLIASASPEAREAYNLLIAENDGFQNLLAGATTEHSASAVADILVEKWGMSPERAAAVMAGAMTLAAGLAAVRVVRTGNEPTKTVASGTPEASSEGSIFGQQRNFWSKDPIQFSGNKVYQRNDLFDPNLPTSWREAGKVVTGTNLERMASGRAPIGTDGKSVNLHHMTQTQAGPIAEMTQSFHQTNSATIHINPNTIPSGIDRGAFDKWKVLYWQQRAVGLRN